MVQSATLAPNRLSAPLGTHNSILNGRARRHFVRDFPGPLSIKSVTQGRVAWKASGRELVVDPDSFLVLQRGEPYSMTIDSQVPVSTFCVFFADDFVESVAASLMQADIEPGVGACPRLARLHPGDERILPRMRALASAVDRGQLWTDQQFLALAADLMRFDREIERRVAGLPARRQATRDELFRRASRGRDFLHAHAAEDLDLGTLARASCLSPFHFHRAFTRAFGKTPHQYRTDLRLAHARRLLETTAKTVTEIAGEVGFESAASFSLLFRRAFGVPPSGIRKLSKFR
jgi:AraC family transcriptional regulator